MTLLRLQNQTNSTVQYSAAKQVTSDEVINSLYVIQRRK